MTLQGFFTFFYHKGSLIRYSSLVKSKRLHTNHHTNIMKFSRLASNGKDNSENTKCSEKDPNFKNNLNYYYDHEKAIKPSEPISIDFMNTQVIYGNRSLKELLRCLIVFTLTSSNWLVDNQVRILGITKRLLGKYLFEKIMEATFFGQFMVRGNIKCLEEIFSKQSLAGIQPMMAYTAPELHGILAKSNINTDEEKWLEDNFQGIIESFEIAKYIYARISYVKPIVATKLTFFFNFDLLKKLDIVICQQRIWLEKLPEEEKKTILQNIYVYIKEKYHIENIEKRSFESLLSDIYFHLGLNEAFAENQNSQMDISKEKYHNLLKLSSDELKKIQKNLNRLDYICQLAKENGIYFMIDAEQTYLQSAIDVLTISLARKINQRESLIFNTYQCYLKKTFEVLIRHVQISEEDNFWFGAKIVRGAYIDEEKKIAREAKMEIPINESYEATTLIYQKVTDFLLNHIAKLKLENNTFPLIDKTITKAKIVFATHNKDSVVDILKSMSDKGLDARNDGILFAQLYGTRDFISYTLGSKNIPVAKMVHYSNPSDGLAYLSRRLVENRSGLPSPVLERMLPFQEIKRRMKII